VCRNHQGYEMRNDDPDYVRSLERALEAAELEIKGLEGELREQDKILAELQEQLAPTRMGEPYITYSAGQLRQAKVEVLLGALQQIEGLTYKEECEVVIRMMLADAIEKGE